MSKEESRVIYPDLSYTINGAAFAVHNELGCYCNEHQYGDLLARELEERGIEFEREYVVEKGRTRRCQVDFLIENKIVVELKVKRFVGRRDYHQVRRYLSTSGKKLGILYNFRENYLRPRRILNAEATE